MGDFWITIGVPMGEKLDFLGQKVQNCKILQKHVSNVILQYCAVLHFLTQKIRNPAHKDPKNDPKITPKHPPNLPVAWLASFLEKPKTSKYATKNTLQKHLSNVFFRSFYFKESTNIPKIWTLLEICTSRL